MCVGAAELSERAEVRVVPPDTSRGCQHGIPTREHPRIVPVPISGMHYHVVADGGVGDVGPDGIDDARGVASADVEVVGLSLTLPCLDDVDGSPRAAHTLL